MASKKDVANNPTPKQLEARRKFAEAAKQRAQKAKEAKEEPKAQTEEPAVQPEQSIGGEPSVADLVAQINELKARMFDQQAPAQAGPQVTSQGVKGTLTKYNVDPKAYKNPVEKLSKEPRLAPFAFDHNYHLDYSVHVSSYETIDGVRAKEPRFEVTLSRKHYDDQGNAVMDEKGGQKAHVIRKVVYHEDPQAAIIVANENGIDMEDWEGYDSADEEQMAFLDAMRYLRLRDWIMDIFFPKAAQPARIMGEEVIGNQLVEIISINAENPQEIPFGQISKKL